jgi:hypothetical protein
MTTPDLSRLSHADKDALIEALLTQVLVSPIELAERLTRRGRDHA